MPRFDCSGSGDQIPVQRVLEKYSFRPVFFAGWASIQPALEIRRLSAVTDCTSRPSSPPFIQHTEGQVLAIAPENSPLPAPEARPLESLRQLSPPHAFYRRDSFQGFSPGLLSTYSQVMSMWESIHAPFLAAADAEPDPIKK